MFIYLSDRSLPSQMLGVLETAGYRCKRRHIDLLKETKVLKGDLRKIRREKCKALVSEDFAEATRLCVREKEVSAQFRSLAYKLKETTTEKGVCVPSYPKVTEKDILEVVASEANIPLDVISTIESHHLLKMESMVQNLQGGGDASGAISCAVRGAFAGVKNHDRHVTNFMFSVPSGMENSEMIEALAAYYCSSGKSVVRIDLRDCFVINDYLAGEVRCDPNAVVFFEGIEKAHPPMLDIVFRVLEDGKVKDNSGFEEFPFRYNIRF